jgi:hypothetical protein
MRLLSVKVEDYVSDSRSASLPAYPPFEQGRHEAPSVGGNHISFYTGLLIKQRGKRDIRRCVHREETGRVFEGLRLARGMSLRGQVDSTRLATMGAVRSMREIHTAGRHLSRSVRLGKREWSGRSDRDERIMEQVDHTTAEGQAEVADIYRRWTQFKASFGTARDLTTSTSRPLVTVDPPAP